MTAHLARTLANAAVAVVGAVVLWVLFAIHDVAWGLPR